MRVVILEQAVDDLSQIFAWMAKDSPTAALDLMRRIRERIGRLETPGLSHMGRFGEIRGTRELIEGSCVVVHEVDDPIGR